MKAGGAVYSLFSPCDDIFLPLRICRCDALCVCVCVVGGGRVKYWDCIEIRQTKGVDISKRQKERVTQLIHK